MCNGLNITLHSRVTPFPSPGHISLYTPIFSCVSVCPWCSPVVQPETLTNMHVHVYGISHTRILILLYSSQSQSHFPELVMNTFLIMRTCWNVFPFADSIVTLGEIISGKDCELIFCTVTLMTNRFCDDVAGHGSIDFLASPSIYVPNGDDIRQLFSFNGEWFCPIGYKIQAIHLYDKISWRIWLSCSSMYMYTCTRESEKVCVCKYAYQGVGGGRE